MLLRFFCYLKTHLIDEYVFHRLFVRLREKHLCVQPKKKKKNKKKPFRTRIKHYFKLCKKNLLKTKKCIFCIFEKKIKNKKKLYFSQPWQ